MANFSSLPKPGGIGVRSVGVLIAGALLFLFIAYVNYHFGWYRQNMLKSCLYAIPIPCFLCIGALPLMGVGRNRHSPRPWYDDYAVLLGVLPWPMVIINLLVLVNSWMNNGLSDVFVLPCVIVAGLLMIGIIVQLIRVRIRDGRTKEA